jgi:adenylate kinase family enzyme
MPAQLLSPNNLLLFLIGRPGAGKSTFAMYLSRALISARVLFLNDDDLLVARAKKLSPSEIKWEPNGQFEILDPALMDELFEELVEGVNSNRSKRPIIVEFSRPNYIEAFAAVPALDDGPYTIVYLDAPLEICIQRKASCALDCPIKAIPVAVLRKDHSVDDLPALRSAYHDRLRIVQNAATSIYSLERAAYLLLKDLLGPARVRFPRTGRHLRK